MVDRSMNDIYDEIYGSRDRVPEPSSRGPGHFSSRTSYMTYLDLIKHGWPQISYLADFMRVTASPMRAPFVAEEKIERASRTRVSCLTYDTQDSVCRIDFHKIGQLSSFLNGASKETEHPRLFVVEDLSRDVIEQLGTHYDIDPLFFRGHISDYMWYNTSDPWVELPSLDLISRKRSFYNVRYVQTRYFRSESSFKRARWETRGFNVLRRLDEDSSRVPGLEAKGSKVGLVRSKISFWTRPKKSEEAGIVGILLVDPTITEGFPIWGGFNNFNDCPSMANELAAPGPPRISIFEDTIYWASSLESGEIASIAQDPRILSKKALFAVCAEWYTVLRYAITRLTQLEWELENPAFQSPNGGLNISIKKLHAWRRRFSIYRTLISEVLEKVVKQDDFISSSQNHLSDLRRDFEIVLADVEDLQARADRIMTVVTAVMSIETAEMSIEENKKGIEQNRSLARLTWLALMFIPLSFVSSLFSMNADLKSLSSTFWIYFVTGIPLTIAVLLSTRYADAVIQGWQKVKEHPRLRRPESFT